MKKITLGAALFFSAASFANGGVAHYDVVAVDKAPDLSAPYNAQYWAEIPMISGDFHYPWRTIPVPKTTFQAAHDNDNLYMVFTAKDPNILSPAADDSSEKAVAKGDRVEVFFAPSNIEKPVKGMPSYYGLEIAPNGKVMDYEAKYYRHLNHDWNLPNLKTAGEIKDGEYVVRIQIPLEELKKLNLIKDDNTMETGVFRAEFVPTGGDKPDQRWISWVNPQTAKPDFHVDSAFGEFRFLAPTEKPAQ